MTEFRFVWDEEKNVINRKKHRVSFEEARTAFYDENGRVYPDPDHSDDEHRFILLGIRFKLRVLIVCHCYREDDTLIRLISARRANRREVGDYGGDR